MTSRLVALLISAHLAFLSWSQQGSIELMSEEQAEESLKMDVGEIETEDGIADLEELSPEQIAKIHREIDANNDGNISLVETVNHAHKVRRQIATQELSKVMKNHDLNGDNKLTLIEFVGKVAEMAETNSEYEVHKKEKEQSFLEMDLDRDGYVDQDELPLAFHHHTSEKVENLLAEQEFKRKDKDGNGKLSPREFWSHNYNDDHTEGIEYEEQKLFDQLDADSDGWLSVPETRPWESGAYQSEEAMKALFEIADENQDALLSVGELVRSKAKIREHDEAHGHVLSWHKEL